MPMATSATETENAIQKNDYRKFQWTMANAILPTKLRYKFAKLHKNDAMFKSDEICFQEEPESIRNLQIRSNSFTTRQDSKLIVTSDHSIWSFYLPCFKHLEKEMFTNDVSLEATNDTTRFTFKRNNFENSANLSKSSLNVKKILN